MTSTPLPEITIEPTAADKRLEILCITLLSILWIGVIWGYLRFPEKIPVHYTTTGQPDQFDSKAYVFTLPAIASFIYILLTAAGRFPNKFIYLKPVTPQNAAVMYRSAVELLGMCKLLIIVGFMMDIANYMLTVNNASFQTSIASLTLQWLPVVLIAAYLLKRFMAPTLKTGK